jgi:hypothetical protein
MTENPTYFIKMFAKLWKNSKLLFTQPQNPEDFLSEHIPKRLTAQLLHSIMEDFHSLTWPLEPKTHIWIDETTLKSLLSLTLFPQIFPF